MWKRSALPVALVNPCMAPSFSGRFQVMSLPAWAVQKPGYVFEGLIDREVRQWILPLPTSLTSQPIMSSGTVVG